MLAVTRSVTVRRVGLCTTTSSLLHLALSCQRRLYMRSTSPKLRSLNHRGAQLSEVVMEPICVSMKVSKEDREAPDGGEAAYLRALEASRMSRTATGDDGFPHLGNIVGANKRNSMSSTNGGCASADGGGGGSSTRDEYIEGGGGGGHSLEDVGGVDYRVSWFDYDTHPSLVFLMWAHRRLRELPPEWRHYYRTFLRQEVKSQLYVTTTWDVFIAVVDGYRKAKWILRKFDVPVDESLIPHPYNNFWEVTTPEERAWAFRRSTKMKEAQAVQRVLEGEEDADEDLADGDDLPMPSFGHIPTTRTIASSSVVSGGGMIDAREHNARRESRTSQTTAGHRLHSADMGPPSERDISTLGDTSESNSMVMGTIEDDKLWNPVLKNRLYQQRTKEDDDLYAFEDDEEFTR